MFRKSVRVLGVAFALLLITGIVPVLADTEQPAGEGQVAVQRININTASRGELVKLEGVGPVYADRIIEYREKHGPFQRPEDIMKVKGIGQKKWKANKDKITVE